PLVAFITLNKLGFNQRTSILTGINMEQISEFSLILFIQAFISNTISNPLFHGVILAASATMILSSYSSRHQDQIYNFLNQNQLLDKILIQNEPENNIKEELENHVIVIGYDLLGKNITEILEEENQKYLVIENDPEKIETLREKSIPYIYGDILNNYTWEISNQEKAKLVISTIPILDISERILQKAESNTILRSTTLEEASKLLESGAEYVIVPKFLASEQMIDHLKGILEVSQYKEELRRKDLLKVRKHLEDQE
ncbi:MAG: NAD-binding protein, partial [Candidatus Nanohaloarchaea archaeon]